MTFLPRQVVPLGGEQEEEGHISFTHHKVLLDRLVAAVHQNGVPLGVAVGGCLLV